MGNSTPTEPNSPNYENEFIAACKKGEVDKINNLIRRGVDVNCRDEDSQATALMWACYQGHLNVVSKLLSLNNKESNSDANLDTKTKTVRVNVEDRDKDGYTALHWAVIHKQPEVVKILIVQGNADINAKNKDLDTPLHKASQYGLSDIVKILITSNALMNLKNKTNKTPLDKARNADIRKLLSSFGAKSGNDDGKQDGHEGEHNNGGMSGENEMEQNKHELFERGMIDKEMMSKQTWREEVRNWLKQIALSEYTDLFLQNGFDRLDVIAELTSEDLKLLDVKPGHIKIILKASAEIKSNRNQDVSNVVEKNNDPGSVENVSDQPQEKIEMLKQQEPEKENVQDDAQPKENEPGQE